MFHAQTNETVTNKLIRQPLSFSMADSCSFWFKANRRWLNSKICKKDFILRYLCKTPQAIQTGVVDMSFWEWFQNNESMLSGIAAALVIGGALAS